MISVSGVRFQDSFWSHRHGGTGLFIQQTICLWSTKYCMFCGCPGQVSIPVVVCMYAPKSHIRSFHAIFSRNLFLLHIFLHELENWKFLSYSTDGSEGKGRSDALVSVAFCRLMVQTWPKCKSFLNRISQQNSKGKKQKKIPKFANGAKILPKFGENANRCKEKALIFPGKDVQLVCEFWETVPKWSQKHVQKAPMFKKDCQFFYRKIIIKSLCFSKFNKVMATARGLHRRPFSCPLRCGSTATTYLMPIWLLEDTSLLVCEDVNAIQEHICVCLCVCKARIPRRQLKLVPSPPYLLG